MKKIFLVVVVLMGALVVHAQPQKLVDTKSIKISDSLYFDSAWHRRWPYTNRLEGGVVSWISGLSFAVTPARYTIGKRDYTSNAGTITLNAADSSLPRLDVIALNTAGQIVKITGTPAASPAIPQIDPAQQIYLTSVLINAGATSPGGGVSSVMVYDEDTEWTHATGGFTGGISFTSTTSPFTGTKSINVTGSGASDASASGGIKFFTAATYNYSDYTVMRFYIKLKAAFPSTAALQVALGNGGEPMTTVTSLHGFNPSLVGVYQNISIPLSDFNRTAPTFIAAYIYISGTGIGYYIDNIQLQSGVGAGTGKNYVTHVYEKDLTDSVFEVINNVSIFSHIDKTGGGGSLTDGNKGDITVSSAGLNWQINPGVVTGAEILNGTIDTTKTDFGHTEAYYNKRYWTLTGNSGTTPGTNFIGTNDNTDFQFKRNGVTAGRVTADNAGLGVQSLASISTGTLNTGFGGHAFDFVSDGSKNTGLGYRAGVNVQHSSLNTAVGYQAMADSSKQNPTNSAAFGANANVKCDSCYSYGDSAALIKHGFGTKYPTERVHIRGSLRIVDGTESNGYIFTSDANGKGSWLPPATVNTIYTADGTQTSATRNYKLGYSGTRYLIFGNSDGSEKTNLWLSSSSSTGSGVARVYAYDSATNITTGFDYSPHAGTNRLYTQQGSLFYNYIDLWRDSTTIDFVNAGKIKYVFGKDFFKIRNLGFQASLAGTDSLLGQTATGNVFKFPATAISAGGTDTTNATSFYQSRRIADSVTKKILADSARSYVFESSDTGYRVFYKKDSVTIHFITFLAGNGIVIDTLLDSHGDTVYSFRVDANVFTSLTRLTDSLNTIRTALAGKQGNIIVTAVGTSGPSTITGNIINIPQYAGGGGSQTPWTSHINANQFSLNNALNIEAKKTIVGTGENLALMSDSVTNGTYWSVGNINSADNVLNDLDGVQRIDSFHLIDNSGGSIEQITNVTAGDRLYLSFQASKPATGGATNPQYFIADWGNTYSAIINYTNYTLTTTLQRFVVAFTVPVGTTQIKFKPFSNDFGTGSFYLGDVELTRDSLAAYDGPYQHTTTTQVFGTISSETPLVKTDSIGKGHIMVGTTTATSRFTVEGSQSGTIVTKTGDYTADETDYTILVNNSGTATITLPAAAGCSGRKYYIKKISGASNDVVIDGNASETIDGVATKTLTTQYEGVLIQSNGTAWFILAKN